MGCLFVLMERQLCNHHRKFLLNFDDSCPFGWEMVQMGSRSHPINTFSFRRCLILIKLISIMNSLYLTSLIFILVWDNMFIKKTILSNLSNFIVSINTYSYVFTFEYIFFLFLSLKSSKDYYLINFYLKEEWFILKFVFK